MRPRPRPEALVGAVLGAPGGPLRVVRLLASGGIAHVFAATTRDGREVALKVLRAELEGRADLVARFEREARAASAIHHENVVVVHETVQRAAGLSYFTTELLVGVDLADVLASQGRLPAKRAQRIARGAALGLGAAHAAGVVHRDVKPENLFLVHEPDGRENVKVLDFGAAWLTGDVAGGSGRLTAFRAFVGTPGYMPPEQADGAPGHPTADIYALGAVLYEMLAGRPPFRARDFAGLLHLHASAPVPEIPGAPPGLEAIVLRCLAKRPEERPASMAELLALLELEPDAPSAP